MSRPSAFGLLLVAPALLMVMALFVYPLGLSTVSAFVEPDGRGLRTSSRLQLYSTDVLFTIFIVVTSTVLIGLTATAVAGYLTLGETPWLVRSLAALYRWPLAAVATIAMCAPTCAFTYVVGRAWERFDTRWRIAIQAGLVPLTIGLVAATAAIVVRSADHNWVAVVVTAVTAAITYWTRINPLWLFGVAALLGIAGLV